MKKLKHILQSKYLFKISAVVLVIISFLYTTYYPFKSKYNEKDNTFVGIVTNYKIKEDKIIIYLKGKEKLIVYYKYGSLVFNELNYGDKLLIKGNLSIPNNNTIFNNFNYKDYLYHKKIYYIINASSIDKLENNGNIIYTIKNELYKKINKLKSKDYIKTLLLGDNTLPEEVKESYRLNGISHLFSISGMHINFIISLLYLYLNKVTRNKKVKYIIIDIFLIFYLLLAYTSSLLRASLMYILSSINDVLKLNISKLDILMITLIIVIIINPFIIYDLGFIYSYIITLFLVMFSKKCKGKNKIYNIIYITLISFIVSLPINIYTSYEINVLSILINILIVPIVGTILLPLTIITLIFPVFDDIMFFVTNLLEKISLYFSNIKFLTFIFCKPNILIIIIYYIIIFIFLVDKKYFYLLLIMISIHYIYPVFNNNMNITMFDVGEGDSILISYPHNKSNILIDTGRDDYPKIDNIIIYLKSKGIKKIDYLIITHGDSDHIGGASSLIDNYKVKKVVLNKGEYTDLEKELITDLNKHKIPYTNNINKININKRNIYFLNNKIFDNENDNSNVIYFEYNKYKLLFMGDASNKVEDYLLDNYNIKDISILKVGHHGSNTSSSKEFINNINPKISLISVGRNNYYDHPKGEVLNNLSKSKIYRTDTSGSIEIKINKSGCAIRMCPL